MKFTAVVSALLVASAAAFAPSSSTEVCLFTETNDVIAILRQSSSRYLPTDGGGIWRSLGCRVVGLALMSL